MDTLTSRIGGRHVASEDTRENINPSDTNDVIGLYSMATPEIVEEAISAASEAAPDWAATSPQQRADILLRIASEIRSRSHELGRLLSREEGKISAEGIGEVTRAAQVFEFFSGEALRMSGDRFPSTRENVTVDVVREPIGVVAAITPWNFPIAIPAWKIAPALAFGNTVVFKPAQLVPASAHALVDIAIRSGLPDGVLNLVLGSGSVLGPALYGSDDVDAISFTGSLETGREVLAGAAGQLTKVQLEMGGKNPLVVAADADLELAVEVALQGAFGSTGQRCTASSRLIVEESVHDQFVERLADRMSGLNVGHALSEDADMGPVVDKRQLDIDLRYLEISREEGAEAILGGELLEKDTPGFYLSPALILGTENHQRVNQEEIFGPIATVIRVADYDEALSTANDTPFGLSSGICTTSLRLAEHFQSHAQAGIVTINLPTAGVDPHAPFGGRKASSYGPREQGSQAREFFTQTKTGYRLP
jgi:alpha-ketoglutaric semialdehyde dehydrogenase